jgi:protein O-mannosyl-transferase
MERRYDPFELGKSDETSGRPPGAPLCMSTVEPRLGASPNAISLETLKTWWRGHPRIVLALVLLLTCAFYWPSLGFDFVYDDTKQIVENPALRSWSEMPHALTESVWGFDEWKDGRGGYFRPVFTVWLFSVFQVFGPDPAGYHLGNLLLHLAAITLVWHLAGLLRLTSPARLVAALVFALHPVNVQAVAWVAASSESLVAILVLGSFALFVRATDSSEIAAERPRLCVLRIAGALSLFLLACLTLERAWFFAIWPVLWVTCGRPLGPQGNPPDAGGRWRPLWAALLFCLPLLITWAIRASVFDTPVRLSAGEPITLGTAMETAPSMALRYLRNLVLPAELSLAYPERPLLKPWPDAIVPAFILAIAAVVALRLSWTSRRRRFLLLAAVLPTLPVLHAGILIPGDLVEDRYVYLASACLAMWIGDVFLMPVRGDPRVRRTSLAVLISWLVFIAVLHPPALSIWRNNVELYSRAVQMAPRNPKYLVNLSNALRRTDPHGDPGCRLLRAARDLHGQGFPGTDDVTVLYNLGNCLRTQADLEGALVVYEDAWRASRQAFHPARYNQVVTLLLLHRSDAALALARELTRTWPDRAAFWRLLGAVQAQSGRVDDAARSLERALRMDPGDAEALHTLMTVQKRRARMK